MKNLNTYIRFLFSLLVALLPLNLGKHFELPASYIGNLLIDYWVPTIYIQDLILVLLLTLWLFTKPWKRIILSKYSFLPIFFLFSIFLSSLISQVPLISFLWFIRFVLYSMLSLYISTDLIISVDLKKAVKVLSISFVFVAFLSILQFKLQHSVFNNYLFFGEQPYSFSTNGIHLENYWGFSKVPPYGLFRHPNILAGLFSIVFTLSFYYLKKSRFLTLILFSIIVFISHSFAGYLSLAVSLLFSLVLYLRKKSMNIGSLSFVLFICLLFLSFGFTFVKNTSLEPSIYRRMSLNSTSITTFINNPLYGIGPLMSVSYGIESPKNLSDLVFYQPVHNIYLLVLSEMGIFSFVFFIINILLLIFYLQSKKVKEPLLICFSQLLVLFSFDHYFFTIHQPLLLMFILLGFAYSD